MRLLIITLYLLLFSLILILLKFNKKIEPFVYLLLGCYLTLIILRLTFPFFFGFRVIEIPAGLFLIFASGLVIFLRLIYFSEFFKDLFNISGNPSKFMENLAKILETKDVLFRKILARWLFFSLVFFRKALSKVPKKLLILLFFIPAGLFILIFFIETINSANYTKSLYFFSLALLIQRVYPKILEFFLGFGNLLFIHNELVYKEQETVDFLEYSKGFFNRVLEIYAGFSQGVWLMGCFSYYPKAEQVKEAENYTTLAIKLYDQFFFPARNWFIFSRVLNSLKRRLLTLYLFLFLFTLYFFYFLPPVVTIELAFHIYSAFFSYIIFFWILKNFSLFKYLAMPINTGSFLFVDYIIPQFLAVYNQLYAPSHLLK